jgi:Ca-activated chloride channel family protein
MGLDFIDDRAFWGFLAIPLLVGCAVWGLRRRKAILKEFGEVGLLSQFSRLSLNRRIACQAVFTILCLALLIVVMARPLLSGHVHSLRRGALDVVAVLDVSKSMAAEDCGSGVSRIEVAKNLLLERLPDLTGNRVGVVTFAGQSFPQAELTDDFQALRFILENWVGVDAAPSQGSNIAAALSQANDLFDQDEKKRIVLLFSDGGHVRPKNLDGTLADIEARDISVVSAGLGSAQGSRVPVYEAEKFAGWLEIDGEVVVTHLNEPILMEIAEATGGVYIKIDSGRELDGIFEDPGVVGQEALAGGSEVFQIPLAASLVFFGLGMYVERRKAS